MLASIGFMAFFIHRGMRKVIFLIALFTQFHLFSRENKNALNEIRNLIENYQYQNALSLIAQQAETNDVLYQKAFCYKQLGNNVEAENILIKLVKLSPQNVNYWGELASIYQNENKWKLALACFDKLVEIDSTNIYFRTQKATMLYSLDRFKESIEINKSLYLNENANNVLHLLGKSYESLNQIDSASFYYYKAWKYDFWDTRSLASYVKNVTLLDQIDSAISACRTYVAVDTTNQQINRLYASAYYLKDKYSEAIDLFQKCRQSGDTSLIVNRSLANSYFEMKIPDSAYVYLRKAFAQDTTNMKVLSSLASTCNSLEKGDEALAYFNLYLSKITPSNATLCKIYKGIAEGYRNEKQFEKAVQFYKFAQKYGSESQNAIIDHMIAEIYYYELEDNAKALPYYKLFYTFTKNYIAKMEKEKDADPLSIAQAKAECASLEKYIAANEKKK